VKNKLKTKHQSALEIRSKPFVHGNIHRDMIVRE